jgi:hypothetical protein
MPLRKPIRAEAMEKGNTPYINARGRRVAAITVQQATKNNVTVAGSGTATRWNREVAMCWAIASPRRMPSVASKIQWIPRKIRLMAFSPSGESALKLAANAARSDWVKLLK